MTERTILVGDPAHPSRLTDNPDDVDNPALSSALSYWRAKRGAVVLPLRESFVPKEVKTILPWVIVADALHDFADFRYRVIGTRVCDYFLGNGTGKTVREAFSDADPELAQSIIQLYQRPCISRFPVRLASPAVKWKGVYFPEYDAIYLPYSSDGETADRIVGVFTFNYGSLREARSVVSCASANHL